MALRSRSARYGGSSTAAGARAKKTAHATGQDHPNVFKRREDWFEGQLDHDPDHLVFIDETWTLTTMARRHGRVPRGELVIIDNLSSHKTPAVRTAIEAAGSFRSTASDCLYF